jgi:hypothetical protein
MSDLVSKLYDETYPVGLLAAEVQALIDERDKYKAALNIGLDEMRSQMEKYLQDCVAAEHERDIWRRACELQELSACLLKPEDIKEEFIAKDMAAKLERYYKQAKQTLEKE